MTKQKTDVLLVNPTRVGFDSYCTPPLHLLYLKKALNDNGYTAEILNVHERLCKAAGSFNNYHIDSSLKKKIEEEAINDVLDWDAKIIGIGGVCPCYEFSERLSIAVKARKNTPIIIGGSLGIPLNDLWLKHTQVDYLCEGDGELLIVKLMKAFENREELRNIPGLHYRKDGLWQRNHPDLPQNLDYISFPDIRGIDHEFYMDIFKKWVNKALPEKIRLKNEDRIWPVVLTRGCLYNCTFCYHFNHRHRTHSIEYVINNLSYLKNEFKVNFIVTWDDLIMANPKWFLDLCDALESAKLGIKIFSSGGKPNIITEEMALKMAKADFFRISFGIESGSQKILDEMQKRATVADNRRAVEVASKANIFVHMNMVLGMPSEDKYTLKETYDFLVDLIRRYNLSMDNISCSFATAYPGTQLYDYLAKKGVIKDKRDYILQVKGVGNVESAICNLSTDELKFFVIKLKSAVNGIYYSVNRMYFKKIINSIMYSRFVYKAARCIPKWLRNKIKDMVAV